jgi:hypothetical protein
MTKWQERFTLSLEEKNRCQLTYLINHCYTMANSQSGSRYTDGVERDIWKAKAKMAIDKRDSLHE